MTARPADERDPLPEPPWQEASSRGIRLLALQATAAAVARGKDRRKQPASPPEDNATANDEGDER